jgi:hypothetical protein
LRFQILVAPDPLAGLFPTKYDTLNDRRDAGMILETFDALGECAGLHSNSIPAMSIELGGMA